MKWLVACGCIWEAAAITSGRIPTLTELNRQYPLVGVAIMVSLRVHLYRARG